MWRCIGIQSLYQSGASGENGALIDAAFVGDFAFIDIRWL
jgi:hypothetical protein